MARSALKDADKLSNAAIFDELRETRVKQDRLWDSMEQVVLAAVKCGRLELAEILSYRLTHFSSTPHRVAYLRGLLLECKGNLAGARELYEQCLNHDETDVGTLPSPAQQSYLTASLSRQKGISLLTQYLDTHYADLSGWLTLSTHYTSLALYPQALTALSHAVILAPHDPWVALKFAETIYTAGEVHMVWKEYLRVAEMSTEEGDEVPLKGAARRTAMGAKLCIPRLRSLAAPADPLLAPAKLDEMDLLLSRLLLDAYTKMGGAVGLGIVRRWLGGTGEAAK
uniref:ER membrane protein complex subunit 2 n=1 Tax=Rhodotorula toruloides TaxID=5286 RepID=A0A0K3CRI8_RHOTO